MKALPKGGTSIPVYALSKTVKKLEDYTVKFWRKIKSQSPIRDEKVKITPYLVLHSFKSPTVCFKIEIDDQKILYAPDLLEILNENVAMEDVTLFFGDGKDDRNQGSFQFLTL